MENGLKQIAIWGKIIFRGISEFFTVPLNFNQRKAGKSIKIKKFAQIAGPPENLCIDWIFSGNQNLTSGSRFFFKKIKKNLAEEKLGWSFGCSFFWRGGNFFIYIFFEKKIWFATRPYTPKSCRENRGLATNVRFS